MTPTTPAAKRSFTTGLSAPLPWGAVEAILEEVLTALWDDDEDEFDIVVLALPCPSSSKVILAQFNLVPLLAWITIDKPAK